SFRISGKLTSLYEGGQTLYRVGSLRVKDRIELWIKHLVYLISGPDGSPSLSRMLTNDFGSLSQEILTDIEKPREILGNLIAFYRQGICAPFIFFPNTSYRYAELIKRDKKSTAAAKSAYNKWLSDYGAYPTEGEDPYHYFIH